MILLCKVRYPCSRRVLGSGRGSSEVGDEVLAVVDFEHFRVTVKLSDGFSCICGGHLSRLITWS